MPYRTKYDEPKHWKVLDHLEDGKPRTVEQLAGLTGMTEMDVRAGIGALRSLGRHNVRNLLHYSMEAYSKCQNNARSWC